MAQPSPNIGQSKNVSSPPPDLGALARHSFEPKPIQELNVRFELESAHKAIPAFRQLPMKLRGDGEYIMKVEGDVLHIYETSGKGIKKFEFTDKTKGGDFDFEEGRLVVSFKGGTKITKIELHSEPVPRSISAIEAHFLPLQDQLLDAKRIKEKGENQTPADKKLLAEIIRQVQARALEPRVAIPVPEQEEIRSGKELADALETLRKMQKKLDKTERELADTQAALQSERQSSRNTQYGGHRPTYSG